jgi:hypothetical protein
MVRCELVLKLLVPRIGYLHDTQDPWYLKVFTEEALVTHQSSVWDPITKQVSSTTDVWISNALALDDELNFTDTPTSSWFPAQVLFEVPDVAVRKDTPALYRDQDSVSTFHSNHRRHVINNQNDAAEETKDENPAERSNLHAKDMETEDNPNQVTAEETNAQIQSQQGSASLRGRPVTFGPSVQHKNEDIMSRISDNNSRISALESHFSNMPMQFSEAIDEMRRQSIMQTKQQDALNLILSRRFPQDQSAITGSNSPVSSEPTGGQSSASSFQDNPLTASPEAGGSDRAAGHGS